MLLPTDGHLDGFGRSSWGLSLHKAFCHSEASSLPREDEDYFSKSEKEKEKGSGFLLSEGGCRANADRTSSSLEGDVGSRMRSTTDRVPSPSGKSLPPTAAQTPWMVLTAPTHAPAFAEPQHNFLPHEPRLFPWRPTFFIGDLPWGVGKGVCNGVHGTALNSTPFPVNENI